MKMAYKAYIVVSCTLRISRSSAGAMSRIHVLASTNINPLQDPHLRGHVSASLCLRLLCRIHISGSISQQPCVSQDPLQNPRLRTHVSASLCLRILFKINVSGLMSQHPYITGSSARSMSPDSCLLCKVHVSGSICISGSSARSTSSDSCLSIRLLCKIHVSGFMSQHPSVSQDPLQDPCLQPHFSASLRLRILYKIHVFIFMPQHFCISGSSARSMSPIHVSASMCISGSSARPTSPDPCLDILFSGSSARSMFLDSCLRIHMYLRILCKVHASGSVISIHVYLNLQDPCLRFMSRHLYISGSSARSMSPDSCLSIHVCVRILCRIPMSPDSYISIHMYLRILCKIHVSTLMSQHLFISGSSTKAMPSDSCLSIFVSQDPLQDPCVRFMS